MTTATAATWPTTAELDVVGALLAKASNAIDALHLRYYKLGEEMVGEGDRAPSLETLGSLACFLEYVAMDLEAIQTHLKTIHSSFHSGTIERAGV